ncbi:MAG: hypothetical protein HY287_12975 [Planctomycetes bacterium]|nr:hypothetical protein [Planctomycetota bacterium]MBI3835236.1 hypothetical protein [Planctomycetota bacterium]
MMTIRAMTALFFFTISQMLRDAKFWVMGIVLLLPSVLALVIEHFAPPRHSLEPAWDLYHGLLQYMFLMGLVPLTCMLYGTGLIGAETESRTIGYLITRRLRRSTVILTRFVATALVLTLLCDVAATAIHISIMSGVNWQALAAHLGQFAAWSPMHDLTVYWCVIALGVLGFLAIFSLIGLLTAKPLALSVIYMVVFELIIGNVPAGARVYTLMHQLRVTAVGAIPGLKVLFALPPELTARLFSANGSGITQVLIISAVALTLACVLITVRELTPSKVARD